MSQTKEQRERVDTAMHRICFYHHGQVLADEVRRLRSELLKVQRENGRLRRSLPKNYLKETKS